MDPHFEAILKEIFTAGLLMGKPELAENTFKEFLIDMHWDAYKAMGEKTFAELAKVRLHRV